MLVKLCLIVLLVFFSCAVYLRVIVFIMFVFLDLIDALGWCLVSFACGWVLGLVIVITLAVICLLLLFVVLLML